MKIMHIIGFIIVLAILLSIGMQIDNPLSFANQVHLILYPDHAKSFADYNYLYALLPRACITVLIGATLGVVGSLMQQLTQNPLTSPLTLGTSSGAWLALVAVNIWLPGLIADYGAMAAMGGALTAFGCVLFITGLNNITGLPLIISGMVVNILLGSITTGLILLHEQFAQNVFMWGAGDLAQNGWGWVQWLWPRLLPVIAVLAIAPRLLSLLRLGRDGAAARGLAVIPVFSILMGIGIWLISASITAVGIIGFIGLLTPNIARAMGARTPKAELLSSLFLGAILMSGTDILSSYISLMLGEAIPSGIAAATIGAPALIWFGRKKLKAQDSLNVSWTPVRYTIAPSTLIALISILCLGVTLYIGFHLDHSIWELHLPTTYEWTLRWPRLLTALFAGTGLAVAGVILQRLINNPLASPDILGVSSGATFALVVASLFLGQSMMGSHWITALLGSLAVLATLILLGRRHNFAPASLILTGISITALLEALIQFCLTKGTDDSYQILLWLGGSTYRVTPEHALILAALTSILCFAAFCTSRWLTLLSIGREFALGRGLTTRWASLGLLSLVALLCAVVTATMGPIAFVGLIAPHLAALLGAQRTQAQMLTGSLIGGTLMVWSDWIGQIALYPSQLAAGIVVSIFGGTYFLCLMIYTRLKHAQ